MKRILLLIILGLYSFNVSAMDIKSKAEVDKLTSERRQELLKIAASASAQEKYDHLAWAFDMYNLSEFNFWLEHADPKPLLNESLGFYLTHEEVGDPQILRNRLSKLKILLKLGANPNENEDGVTPLRQAIQCGIVEGAKILLADPRTDMDSNLQHDSYTLMMEAGNNCHHGGNSWTEQQKNCSHKKMVKLLLFMGCNAPFKNFLGITAAGRARNRERPDIALIIEDYKNIEKHCTKEELAEFSQVKLRRQGINPAYLMCREIGGLQTKRIAKKAPTQTVATQTAAAPATAVSFTWPSTKDSKENSK